MKRALFASVVALLCACGSSSTDGTGTGGNGGTGGTSGGGADMSASAGQDAAMSLPPDMLPAYGCNSLNACIDGCSSQSCYLTCYQSATSQAQMLYQAAARCVRQLCAPKGDAGTGPCSGGGTPTPECTQCQDDSIKMQGSCGSDTTYCGKCYAQYSACIANKP